MFTKLPTGFLKVNNTENVTNSFWYINRMNDIEENFTELFGVERL
jgi:hypothetical protein